MAANRLNIRNQILPLKMLRRYIYDTISFKTESINNTIISGKFADGDPSLISASTHNNEDGELMIETPTLYLEQNLILPICD